MTPFTKPFNAVTTTVTIPHLIGSGVLVVDDVSFWPVGIPSPDTPIRLTCVRQSDFGGVIFKATGRVGHVLTGVTAVEGTFDVTLDAGDTVEQRPTAGYFDDIHQAIHAIEAGGGGGGGTAHDTASGTNRESVAIQAGTPACVHSSGVGFLRASAADANGQAVGLVVATADAGAAATVLLSGVLTLDDWTAVTGAADLAPRSTYYLGLTPGTLSLSPPSSSGNVVQQVGRSVGPQSLDVSFASFILL